MQPNNNECGTGVGLDNRNASFPTTCWTVLADADGRGSEDVNQVFANMSARYWYPFYAYLRRTGSSSEDAQDLTQGFFAHLLSADRLSGLDRERGRFRSYLLGSLKNYASTVRKHQGAKKRGGGSIPVSIDRDLAETRYQGALRDDETPESIFDRQWAFGLMKDVMQRLKAEYAAKDKAGLFEKASPFLTGESERGDYRSVAAELEMSEANLRQTVSRMRGRFQSTLCEVVAGTVRSRSEIDAEVRHLMASLGS